MSEYYGILISFMLPFSRKVAENMLLQEISDIAESLPVAVLVVPVIPPSNARYLTSKDSPVNSFGSLL